MGRAARRVADGRRIPVVLLTGFLGAGKTTALNTLLADVSREGTRVAVVVNEFGELGIDASLLGPGAARVWEINNGSPFCDCLRADLQKVLAEIEADVETEEVLIEASGLADPVDLARALDEPALAQAFEMEAAVCLVDPLTFPRVARSVAAVGAQVREADLVLLNKCDLADETALAATESRVREIRPEVPLVRTTRGRVSRATLRALPRRRRSSVDEPTGPPQNLASVAYESRIPVDRGRFYELLETWRPRCMRAKGQVLFEDGPFFVEISGGRVTSCPMRPGPGQAHLERRTSFVAILEGLDPVEARAALRDCERPGRAPRLHLHP